MLTRSMYGKYLLAKIFGRVLFKDYPLSGQKIAKSVITVSMDICEINTALI